jgi:two-component system, OmpR family, KDP operon response regulator KdpE
VTKILIVDDEPQILRALRITLHARGYEIIIAGNGSEALKQAELDRPDLVLLDLGLPDLDGAEVVRRLRRWSAVPIVILSGRMDSTAKVDALDAGADDYVTKPFSVDELAARLRAVSRRLPATEPAAPIRIGRHMIDLEDRRIVSEAADGQPGESDGVVHLTPIEWQLLIAVARNPGHLVSQRQLLQEVWGPSYVSESHYLRQYLKHLRRKLEDDPGHPRHLITEPGMGYRFQP